MDHFEINTIRGQFQSGLWPQFLQMVQIDGLRGWSGQSVDFNFPVVAIVGENGSGKSTLLKVAACAYADRGNDRRYYPSTFFIETVWDRIQDVKIEYRVRRGPNVETYKISKQTKRWRVPKNAPERDVFILDISRTLPLDASVGYAKIARMAASEIESLDISDDYRTRLSYVLGREYKNARFATSDVDANRQVGLLEREWGELSQFHQGAGEDATLDLFRTLQGLPEYSLLLIDEVEASLHPRAQRRLTKFLLWLSRQRRIQVILTTHSPYVLQELPQEARILLLPGPQGLSIVTAISTEFAMSRLDDEVHPELNIFVEDREAEVLLREILASDESTAPFISRVKISGVGPANVVMMLGDLSVSGKLPYKSLAVLDGDYSHRNCFCLPGVIPPERVVYTELRSNGWFDLSSRFGVGPGALYSALEDAMLNCDHHKWNSLVGDQVHKSSNSVWEIMATTWCKHCLTPEYRASLLEKITSAIS